jgi:hypothetical protein
MKAPSERRTNAIRKLPSSRTPTIRADLFQTRDRPIAADV